MTTETLMRQVKAVSAAVNLADTATKNRALHGMAAALLAETENILAANAEDCRAAEGVLSPVMMDRLLLTEARISAMAAGVREVAALPDPVGRELESHVHPKGFWIRKVASPLGVVAIIYESRPNVTADAAALAVKSGNACILRCGKEAHRSAAAITNALRQGLTGAGLPAETVSLVEDTSRESANALMRGVGFIDLLIPRGGKGLISACVENARVPCIETGTGICHIYVDAAADVEKALTILENAKKSRPSVCNAAEVCLVHEALLPSFLPAMEARLTSGEHPVQLRADAKCLPYLKTAVPAGEQDFDTEFLDYVLAVGAVADVSAAIRHIAAHSTHHSDAIVTEDPAAAAAFTAQVDSAAVYVNVSTRFTDGGEFGLGCEMGISTQKLHARGPMGLEALTTYRYIVTGGGQIR